VALAIGSAPELRSHRVARAMATFGLLSMLSPLVGFMVEIGLAHYAGVSAAVDSYRATSTLLNLGTQLFFGALTLGILIPLITECNARGDLRAAWRLTLLFGMALSVLEVPLLYAAMAWPDTLVGILAPGLKGYALDDCQFQLRGFAITLVPMLWAGVFAAYLQANEIFWVTALSQSFNNVAVVAFLLVTRNASLSLVYGNVIGVSAMFTLHAIRVLRLPTTRAASDWAYCWQLVRRGLSMMVSPLAAMAPSLAATTIFLRALSLGPRGTLAECGYAGKPLLVVTLVTGVFASVVLPQMSQARFRDASAFENLARRSLRFTLILVLPLTGIAFALRQPLIATLFGSRLMSDASLRRTATYFGVFLIGAPATALAAILSQVCSALYDTRGAAIGTVLTAVVAFALVPILASRFGPLGVVAVIGTSGWVVCLWLVTYIAVVHRLRVWNGMGLYILKMIAFSGIAGVVSAAAYSLCNISAGGGQYVSVVELFASGVAAVATIWMLGSLLGLTEVNDIGAYLRWQLTSVRSAGTEAQDNA